MRIILSFIHIAASYVTPEVSYRVVIGSRKPIVFDMGLTFLG